MVKLSVNLDDVESMSFEIIPAGIFDAKVTDIMEKESSSGNPMLVWSWEVITGEHDGASLKSYTTLQAHALFGLKEHLTAFGIEGDLDGLETDSIIGKTAQLKVTKNVVVNRESGEDMEVNRVSKVLPSVSAKKNKKITTGEIPL